MSYPFEYLRSRNWSVNTGIAYVLHPFDGDGDEFAESVVRDAVEAPHLKLKFQNAKSKTGAAPILEDILTGIAEADLVIGVLVDSNPNVFWEIGIAMTWKPSSQVLTVGRIGHEDGGKLPFNLRGFRHLFVEADDAAASTQSIQAEIGSLRQRHSDLMQEAVVSAHNSLGPAELAALAKWGPGKGHFFMPAYSSLETSERYSQPSGSGVDAFDHESVPAGPRLLATHMDGITIGNLSKLGLLALSTLRKETGVEYSFYWTPLGNLVLEKCGWVNGQEVERRYEEMPPLVRDWRGGFLFNPVLPS